jgi:hypothetical protein
VLYLDFRQGRLKLLGSLVFPRNKLLVLRAGQGDSVLAEDVFENVVGGGRGGGRILMQSMQLGLMMWRMTCC